MKLRFASREEAVEADLLAIVLDKEAVSSKKIEATSSEIAEQALRPIELGDFDGSLGSSITLYSSSKPPRLVLSGAGSREDWEDALERIRVGVAKAVSEARRYKRVSRIAIQIANTLLGSVEDEKKAYREALVAAGLANYSFQRREKKEEPHRLGEIAIIGDVEESEARKARAIVESVYLARDVANSPPAEMNPEKLEEKAREVASREGLKIRVFHKQELEEMGMGGIIGVGKGSSVEPRLIILEYDGGPTTIAVVGKAVTFDSGGLDLKTAEQMYDMKFDKSGGAAALGAVVAARKLGLPVRLVALIPAVENMPSGSSYKPRDVIRMYNGMTVEVGNTDAEGRLILADALAYAAEKYKPDYIIDLATLTGSIVIALGNQAAGLFSNNEELASMVERAAWSVWEPVWRLPLWKPYYKQLESQVADTNNIGGREAGAITAAAFLSKFVGDRAWAHLDIAGVAWTQRHGPSKPYYPKGATGWGVRTVVELAEQIVSRRKHA